MDVQFNLRDRVAVIVGPFTTLIQNMMMGLTQLGADVVLLDKDAQQAQKYCQNLTDQREINEKFGRAMAIKTELTDRKVIKDALGQAVQTFGSLDIYIDAMLTNSMTPMNLLGDETDIDPIINQNLRSPILVTQVIIPFLKGRKRGRILYLMNGGTLRGAPEDLYLSAARAGLIQFAKGLANQTVDLQLSINVLSLGLTEEYILGHYPESTSIKEAVEKHKLKEPFSRLTEQDRVTQAMLFLISQFGVGITGQVLSV